MSLYPNLSKAEHRWCGLDIDYVCPTFPCIHTACHDPDWLEDLEEAHANLNVRDKAWGLYHSLYGKTPSLELKNSLSPAEWAFYEPKVERCCRITAKKPQIEADRKAYKIRAEIQFEEEEEEICNMEEFQDDPVIIHLKEKRRKAKLLATKL
jgi:hypothetical protein